MKMLTPDKFAEASVYELIKAAALGQAGLDRRWVRAIVNHGEAAVPDLVRFGMEDHASYPIPLDEELLVIFRHLRSPTAVPFFIDYLRRVQEDLPENFVDALLPVRQEALEPLIQLYDELSEEDAGEVAFALAAFRIRDERVLKILLDRLEYDAGDGALCLGLYGDPAARPAMEKMLLEVEDDHLKRDITDAIGQLGRSTEEEPDAPFDVYEYFPDKALPEFSVLTDEELGEMLESSDPDYRFSAAAGFVNQQLEPDTIARLFLHAQTDESHRVRAKCWEALGNETSDESEIFKAMLARLQDESASQEERAGALAGLGQRADEQPIRKYVEQFYENPETRAAALGAMWNSLDRGFAPYFPPHISD
ncbi:MAG: hypothetical protein H7039_09465, partial [Bryobacteraceae bacterium]|nr:hypothetical protein [Bryobacteraceae bacterium]